MSASSFIVCNDGVVSTGTSGEPICSGTWGVTSSALGDLALSTSDIASIAGPAIFAFALVWCFKIVVRVILNQR